MAFVRHLEFKNFNFRYWVLFTTPVYPSVYYIYNILLKYDISQKYGDITIFKMAVKFEIFHSRSSSPLPGFCDHVSFRLWIASVVPGYSRSNSEVV